MSKSDAFNQSLVEFKQQLSMKLLQGFAIFCTVGLPISMLRWAEIGFQLIFIHHILITLTVYAFCIWSSKTRFKLNLIVIIGLLSSMIISGSLSFGLQGGAANFVAFCTLLTAVGWGFTAAFVYTLAACSYLTIVGFLFSKAYLVHAVSPSEYEASMGAWIVVALGACLIIVLSLIIARQALRHFSRLIEKIEGQKVEIEHLANTDNLTGFSSARLAMPLLSQAINFARREHSQLGVVFIDLNNFKTINDTHGHHTGDLVLKEVALRIRSVLRDMDIACRIGGDEFLIIIPRINSIEEIDIVLRRVVDTWSTSISLNKHDITISGSIGVAMYPDDAKSEEELLKKADKAMYSAKNNGLAIKYFK